MLFRGRYNPRSGSVPDLTTVFRTAGILSLTCILWAAGCASQAPLEPAVHPAAPERDKGAEVVLFAMSLIDTKYRFGGKNPESGFDCSGMVSYIYQEAAGYALKGSAAQMARLGRKIPLERAGPGDLVFFNTRNRPRSHVGIYIGQEKFVHAPSRNGRVRVNSLRDKYFSTRFEEARRYLD